MMSFASVPLRLSERVSERGCDPVSVTDAWQSVEASATMPEVSAEVVAASKVKRTFRLARPTGTYVPEKLGPSLDCALHVPSVATVIEVTKAPRSLPQPGTVNFDVPVRVPVPVKAVAAVGAASESASRIPFTSILRMSGGIAGPISRYKEKRHGRRDERARFVFVWTAQRASAGAAASVSCNRHRTRIRSCSKGDERGLWGVTGRALRRDWGWPVRSGDGPSAPGRPANLGSFDALRRT